MISYWWDNLLILLLLLLFPSIRKYGRLNTRDPLRRDDWSPIWRRARDCSCTLPIYTIFFFSLFILQVYIGRVNIKTGIREKKIRVGRSKKELTSLGLYSSLGVSRRTLNSINFGGKKGRKEQAGYQKKKKRKKSMFWIPQQPALFLETIDLARSRSKNENEERALPIINED